MGRNRFKELCGTALICALLAGCSQEDVMLEPDAASTGSTFTLSPEVVREVTVKSGEEIDDGVISDVWVLQVDASGNVMTGSDGQLLKNNYPLSTPAGENLYPVTLTNLSTPAKIYFMANMGGDPFTGKTSISEADIEAAAREVQASGVLNNKTIPMVGVWAGGSFERIPMTPSVATVKFTLQTELSKNQGFAVRSIQLKNVANKVYYYRDETPKKAEGVVDYTVTVDYKDEAGCELNPTWGSYWLPGSSQLYGKILSAWEDTPASTEVVTWYLPENVQGEGKSTSQWEKNGENAPSEFCTYVEIIGYYNYNGLVNEVTYQIYLGEDAVNNYSLERGTSYNITATIKGQHTVDTRVTPVEPQNYIDYTDNRMPWFVVNVNQVPARIDNDLGEMVSDSYVGNWKVPQKKELMLEWIYQLNKSAQVESIYWADEATDINGDFTTDLGALAARWSVSMGDGKTIAMEIGEAGTQNLSLRPIMDVSGFQYPYVKQNENGRDVIVSRDEFGGAENVRIPEGMDLWSSTPSHDEQSTNNTVAAQFEIATIPDQVNRDKKTWADAEDYCESLNTNGETGWRMPTQRELMLMYVMNDQLKNKLMETKQEVEDNYGDMSGNITDPDETADHIFYWSATGESGDSANGWSVCLCTDEDSKNGKTEGYAKTVRNFVRCVRDIEWKNN